MANGDDAHLYERVSALEASSAHHTAMLQALQEGQDRLLKKADQPTNWIGIGGLVFGAFSFLFAIMSLATSANKELIDDTRDWAGAISDRVRLVESQAAAGEKRGEWYQQWIGNIEEGLDREISRNADLEERVSRSEGLLGELKEQVNNIDAGGSRRWNKGTRPE